MNSSEFENKHREIIKRYNVDVEPNSDLWSAVTGLLYFEHDQNDEGDFITEITGISYLKDGTLVGSFGDYLQLLEAALKKHFTNKNATSNDNTTDQT